MHREPTSTLSGWHLRTLFVLGDLGLLSQMTTGWMTQKTKIRFLTVLEATVQEPSVGK